MIHGEANMSDGSDAFDISRRRLLGFAAAAPLIPSSWSVGALAEEAYPAKTINVVSPFPPATGADVVARYFADQLAKRLGKTVIVENKVGADGLIGTQAVALAKADGHTILVGPGQSLLAVTPNLLKSVPFDPVKDFQSITTLLGLQMMLAVSATSPYKTVAELTASLKAKGDKASFASFNNSGLVCSELYRSAFSLNAVEVKYRDPSTALNDIKSGSIDFMHVSAGFAAGWVSAGHVRVLATSSARRSSAFPDVPSAKEVGIPGDVESWFSAHVPAHTPTPVVDKLEAVFNDIVGSQATKDFFAPQGMDPLPGNRRTLDELLARDLKVWAEYIKLARIEKK